MKNIISILFLFAFLTSCSATSSTSNNSDFIESRYATYLYGVEQEKKLNYKNAFKAYQKAAKNGLHQAQMSLGYFYYNGKGVKKNYKKAAYWTETAMNKGYDPIALYNLAQMYRKGHGVVKNYTKAMKYYRVAANFKTNPNVNAQYNLGVIYHEGLMNMDVDLRQAKIYFLKAAKYEHLGAQNNLGAMYKREGDYQKAIYWYKKAARKGHKLAIQNLNNNS